MLYVLHVRGKDLASDKRLRSHVVVAVWAIMYSTSRGVEKTQPVRVASSHVRVCC